MRPGLASQDGFSVLEALAALAVMALSLLALLEVKAGLFDRQLRRHDQARLVVAHANALALLRRVDPARVPEGELQIERSVAVRWTSTQVVPARPEIAWQGRQIDRLVALYRLDYGIWIAGDQRLRGSVERVGRPMPPPTRF